MIFRAVFTDGIFFLVIKFVLDKINLTLRSTKLIIVIFCCVFWISRVGSLFHCNSDTLLYSLTPSPEACSGNICAETLQCTMQKTSYKFPSDFPFIAYLLNSNYEKSLKCNPTFRWDIFFPILSKYGQASKSTALLSEFSFPKKGKNKSRFRMVNWCNGGTKDFVELWEIIHLKISTFHQINEIILN